MLVAVQLSVPGLYFPPVFKNPAVRFSAPDDHFAAGPDCRMKSRAAGAFGAGGCPTIGAGIVSPAGVKSMAVDLSAPDDHFTAGPYCRVKLALRARWWCWWLSSCRCRDYISRRCSNRCSCHYIRPRRSFHCRSTLPCDRARRIGALVVLVAVQLSVVGLYLPPVFKSLLLFHPPQTIISLPVHTAV